MRFNFFKSNPQVQTVNHEGEVAFTLTPEMELYNAVVTTALHDTMYESQDKRLARIIDLIKKCDTIFVIKLAIYARTKMHLRTISQVLMVEVAKMTSGNPHVQKGVTAVIQRADEITEMLAYYQMTNTRNGIKKLNKLSKQLQKGVANAFYKFDEYQFAKYNRDTDVKLRDALFLTHPKALNEAQQLLFKKIADNTLATPYTWEVELSVLGQQKFENEAAKADAIKAKWEELIDANRLGYMAMLRNLRNIIAANVSYFHIQKVCAYLSNENAVVNSKQLPFRFLAAYREITHMHQYAVANVKDALEVAVKCAAKNISGFDANTRVLLACDVSGSMQKTISAKSKIMYYDIGLILAMLMQSKCDNVVTGMFGDTWKAINMSRVAILENVEAFYRREGEVGYATNGYKVIDYLINNYIVMDKVMMFTDLQMWDSAQSSSGIVKSWHVYKNKVAPKAKLYLFDLAGYGNVPLRIEKGNVFLIAGWSDKIFDVLQGIEKGQSNLAQIENIVL